MKKISFVIPCYCSANTISDVVDEISSTMQELPDYCYEVVLVNDCSPDGTFQAIREICKKNPCVKGINLARNFGQHAALMAGFHNLTGDIVVCLDDDGQTPADEVGKLLQQIENGFDVAYASYEHKQHSGFRNFGSKVNKKMTEILLGNPIDLFISSYFAAKRYIIDEMIRYEGCYPYVIGLVLRATKNICNVPVNHRRREQGQSGYTLGKLLSLWMNGFTSFSVKPLRIATYFGVACAGAGFCYLLAIIVRYALLRSAPMGWSSIVALMLIMGGVILLVLGMIGEYIGRIYMCVNATPQFLVKEVITYKTEEKGMCV